MLPERYVSLFRNGRNQALRIPREFELPAGKAIVRKDGDKTHHRACQDCRITCRAGYSWGY